MPDRSRIIAGILFFVLAAQFLLVLMICESLAPDYSVHTNAISDLGVTIQTAWLFNTSVFIVGFLEILGAAWFHNHHRNQWVTIIFIIAGIGALGVAVFTLDSPLHSPFALIAFLFTNLEALGCGSIFHGPFKLISIVSGIIGLSFLLLHIFSLYGPIGHGGSERMIVYPVLLWMMALGGYLINSPYENRKTRVLHQSKIGQV